ncbi:uncharacterized protein IWZ02DRAFT_465303 [Phyllosticta citriasiana]|uniref:uncharacterized protein n=1 Tax=Phyllosticta citriasiana TaxID=595635 RepID=UPI0030FDDCAB
MATRKTSMQVWLWSSAALSGGVGWYLYQAGGSKKAVEREAQREHPRLGVSRPTLTCHQENSMTSAKTIGAEAGQKIDSAINEARTTANRVDQKLEAYRAQADRKVGDYSTQVKKDAHNAVEQFDKTVEDQAAKSKSWLSGWFK